jgi:hypothetical protein
MLKRQPNDLLNGQLKKQSSKNTIQAAFNVPNNKPAN